MSVSGGLFFSSLPVCASCFCSCLLAIPHMDAGLRLSAVLGFPAPVNLFEILDQPIGKAVFACGVEG